jgi:hypothetical protein
MVAPQLARQVRIGLGRDGYEPLVDEAFSGMDRRSSVRDGGSVGVLASVVESSLIGRRVVL